MLKLYGFNEGIQIIAHAYPIKHLSVDSDADADLVKIYGLTWMKYLGIRTSLVTMHAPWVVHTTAVGQRRRNYDVTIARHQTLRSHAWRITGGSRHALTPQYLDKTDSADRRRYSCDVIKTLQRQRPPGARLQRLLPRRLFADTPGTGDYTLRVI